jgi:F-type H+-transporting ATPase subunit a
MASAVLHIKDSYYFEVPKSLWPTNHASVAEFPDVWVKLDPHFQQWAAERLYEGAFGASEEVPSFEQLRSDWLDWQHERGNTGKPFQRYLEESRDTAWFREQLQDGASAERWETTKREAADVRQYKADTSIQWSPQKMDAYNRHLSGKILIPQPFGGELRNLYQGESGFCLSKFMVLQLVVVLLLWLAFSWLARRVGGGSRPQGRIWNLLEAFVVFIRDQIARPAIGKHDADRFVPLLLTLFFFILGCNLLGMLPWMGAPTASFGVTLGLACVTFGTVIIAGMRRFGPIGFFTNMAPTIDLPLVMALPIASFVLLIEVVGLLIRHTVLAIRLLANMVAGHIVLLAIMLLAFSVEGAASSTWGITAVIAVVGSTLFSCLELFVAFLQAYIFTFLSALFIGSAIHHH